MHRIPLKHAQHPEEPGGTPPGDVADKWTHARFGSIVATVPGGLALPCQLARVEVPSWLAGIP